MSNYIRIGRIVFARDRYPSCAPIIDMGYAFEGYAVFRTVIISLTPWRHIHGDIKVPSPTLVIGWLQTRSTEKRTREHSRRG